MAIDVEYTLMFNVKPESLTLMQQPEACLCSSLVSILDSILLSVE